MLSRVADSLYWLSRYLERAEHTARLIDVQTHLMLDLTPAQASRRWELVLDCLHAEMPRQRDAYGMAYHLTLDAHNPDSILSCIAAARENARQLREHISSEMWEQLNRQYLDIRTARLDEFWDVERHAFFVQLREQMHLFQGITDGTMNYNEGYQFMQVGRYIERAGSVARLLDVFFSALRGPAGTYDGEYLDWIGMLKSCTAFEAYCKVYTADLRPNRIAEFLILNAEFPHSIAFCTARMRGALNAIAQQAESRRTRQINRLAGRLASAIDFGQVDEILAGGMHSYLDEIAAQCASIHDALHQTYIAYPVEQELAD